MINFSSIYLLNTLMLKVSEYNKEYSPFPVGCVSCGDGQRITVGNVPGYGGVCAGHARTEPRTVKYPWYEEGTELDRRGLRALGA